MPEGHTVHRLARTFASLFAGQVLRVSSPQGRFDDGAGVLTGRRLVASEALGKQLFLGFEGDLWLRTHLGLYGAWTFAGAPGAPEVAHAIGAPRRRIGERETTPSSAPELSDVQVTGVTPTSDTWEVPQPRGQVRVRLLGTHAVADLTGPTACEVITPDEKRAVEARLGPDPIRDDGDPAAFVARVGRSRVTIGQQLMDQSVVAGVGNIYRAEALFRAGVDPLRPGRDLPAEVVRAIWDDLVVLMRDGAARGAIVTTRQSGSPGAVPPDQAFYVYRRDGLPCRRCGSPVLVKELAGRNLFWCGVCQT